MIDRAVGAGNEPARTHLVDSASVPVTRAKRGMYDRNLTSLNQHKKAFIELQ